MRTNIVIDNALMADALEATGLKSKMGGGGVGSADRIAVEPSAADPSIPWETGVGR
jgi:Arc/MetJ family transcription regulator